ncbi:MAG: protease modulator HflK, partial [Desulfatiglandales bacterium]
MEWDWDRLKRRQDTRKVPDLEGIFKNFGRLNTKIPGGGVGLLIFVGMLIWGFSCVYTIGADETGVVQRFGKFVRLSPPGLNFKLPAGIESLKTVKTRYVFKEEFGFRTVEPGIRTTYATKGAFEAESLMLTGDLNVAVVPWVVQYRIEDPYRYLFKVRDVRSTLRDLAEATMRLVVGDRSINEVISKREEMAREAMGVLQNELDKAETGIRIVTIEMKRTNVPEPVQPSFNEVNQALQEKERTIYQAKEEYN